MTNINFLSIALALLSAVSACAHTRDNAAVGLTLLFQNKSKDYLVVKRFDPDGLRGPVPGFLGAGSTGGKQMSFMAGDSKRGVPQFIDVQWAQSTPEAEAALEALPQLKGNVSTEEREIYTQQLNAAYAKRLNYARRIDLSIIIYPELLAQVRANRSTTHLKLGVIFKDENVTFIAEPYVWKQGRFSASDSSPEAMAEFRAAHIAASTLSQNMFYGHGYYVGEVAGALSGSLTSSVHTDGTVRAVIVVTDGPAINVSGAFDTSSNEPVRTLKLTGKSSRGTTTLTGHIDLKARRLSGEWTTSPPSTGSATLSGSFKAER